MKGLKGISGTALIAVLVVFLLAFGAMFYFMTGTLQQLTAPKKYNYVGKELTYKFRIKNQNGLAMTNGSIQALVFSEKPVGFDSCDQALLESPQNEQGVTINPEDSDSVDANGEIVLSLLGGQTYYILFKDVQTTPTEYWFCKQVSVPSEGEDKPTDFVHIETVKLKDLPTVTATGTTTVDVTSTGDASKQPFQIFRTIAVTDGTLRAKELKISNINTGELGRLEVSVGGKNYVIYDYWLDIDNIPTSGDYKISLDNEYLEGSSLTITVKLKVDTLNATAVSGDHKLSPGESVATFTLRDYAGTSIDTFTVSAV